MSERDTTDTPQKVEEAPAESWEAPFLAAFRETGNIRASAQAARVGRKTIYRHLESRPEFKERFADAKADAGDVVSGEIRRRGIVGWEEPVFYQGAVVGAVRKYSDTLLIFLAKALMPEVYRDPVYRHEHTGAGGGPIQEQHLHVHAAAEEFDRLAESYFARRDAALMEQESQAAAAAALSEENGSDAHDP
jgi:hypothetical protein